MVLGLWRETPYKFLHRYCIVLIGQTDQGS
jgi:hypothetical protein